MIIRSAKTRGMKYQLELHQVSANLYNIQYLTHGRTQGQNCNIPSLAEANQRFDKIIAESAEIDGINYGE